MAEQPEQSEQPELLEIPELPELPEPRRRRWKRKLTNLIKSRVHRTIDVQLQADAQVKAEASLRTLIDESKPTGPAPKNWFYDFPYEIQLSILKEVVRTPSWIWYRFDHVYGDDEEDERPFSDTDSDSDSTRSSLLDFTRRPTPLTLYTEPEKRRVVITDKTLPFTNEELNACPQFRMSRELRTGLSASGEPYKLHEIALRTADDLENTTTQWGPLAEPLLDEAIKVLNEVDMKFYDPPFSIEIQKLIKTPKVRRQYDWFFLDGYITSKLFYTLDETKRFPDCKVIREAETVVLRLQDLYDGLCWAFGTWELIPGTDEYGYREPDDIFAINRDEVPDDVGHRGRRPDSYQRKMKRVLGYLADEGSRLEELIILVGDVPDNVQPRNLENLQVRWNNDSTAVIVDANPPVSERDRKMMRWIMLEFQTLYSRDYGWCFHYMDDWRGNVWRHMAVQPTQFSVWLDTGKGREWLRTQAGLDWLATEPAQIWLAWNYFGRCFLDSDQGVEWLNSKQAVDFLRSEYAKHWAQHGKRQSKGGPAKAQLRKWYQTSGGGDWYLENCPDGIPPESTLKAPPKKQPINPDPSVKREPLYWLPWNMWDVFPRKFRFMRYRSGSDDKGKGKAIAY
ncbi:hypothetical protein HD806DRAFT_543985 [Xylariaceae sp. AK1471]|nr:hypothetical protein HD806DRAFT_543985 [Xylariaceae sp. AK1471]